MRVHTCLHLLSVVIPLPVSGGAITAEKGRLDFAMPEPPEDKVALEAAFHIESSVVEADRRLHASSTSQSCRTSIYRRARCAMSPEKSDWARPLSLQAESHTSLSGSHVPVQK